MRNVLIFLTLLLTSGVPGCGSDELPAVPRTSDASVKSALPADSIVAPVTKGKSRRKPAPATNPLRTAD